MKLKLVHQHYHDYPAIHAVTAAIAAVDSISTDEPLAIELEQYHHELQRLEAESAQQALEHDRQRPLQHRLEGLVGCWQQQQLRPDLAPTELELLIQHLSSTEGRGFLMAVTISTFEEQRFCDWLMGRAISHVSIVDRPLALESALDRWRNHQNLSLEEKQSLLHYVREPEGLGVLRAYTNPTEEYQFQAWLSEQTSGSNSDSFAVIKNNI